MIAPFRQMTSVYYSGWSYVFTVNLGDPPMGNPGWNDDTHNLGVVETWCNEQFGLPISTRWAMFGWSFVFMDLADALAFKIRWC